MKLTITGEVVGHHDISVILSRELEREERGSKVCVLRLCVCCLNLDPSSPMSQL